MEHTAITRAEFRFPYSRDIIYFKTDSPLLTYDEKGQPTTYQHEPVPGNSEGPKKEQPRPVPGNSEGLQQLLQNNVIIKGTIFQYNFESQGKRIIGVTVKIREVRGLGNDQKGIKDQKGINIKLKS